jgi:hypothetical protein
MFALPVFFWTLLKLLTPLLTLTGVILLIVHMVQFTRTMKRRR